MLTRLYADNFRCLVNFECPFARRQLLLGRNGAGKSTIFDVLALIRDACSRGNPLDSCFGGVSRTRWQNEPEQSFELGVRGNGGEYLFRIVIDTWGVPERPRVLLEEVTFDGAPIFRFDRGEVHLFNDRHEDKVQYPFDWYRSALATMTDRRENTKLTWFRRWLSNLLVVSPDPRRMLGVAATEAKHPDLFLENFADWYRHLRQETDDFKYIADLREAIESFVGMRLEDAGERRREVKVRMSTSDRDVGSTTESEFQFSELSDGQRALIGLYAVLHFGLKENSTVCFDEPDNFIALREIQPWLMKLCDLTDDGAPFQALIVSHHPELLNRLAFQEGLLLDRPNGRHTRVHRFDDPSATGLTAAELVALGWERD